MLSGLYTFSKINHQYLVCLFSDFAPRQPEDSSSCGGSLYAYQLPPADDIVTLTVEEEIADKKPSVSLTEIQRGVSASKYTLLCVSLFIKPIDVLNMVSYVEEY